MRSRVPVTVIVRVKSPNTCKQDREFPVTLGSRDVEWWV